MDEFTMLNIYVRIFFRKAKFMFKISKSVLPSYINQLFPFDPSVSKIYECTGFYTPRPHAEIFKQSLIYSGPVIWNNLPNWLKN